MNAHAPSAGLGAMLQRARRRAGLTQEQLAGLSTVSVRAIRDLEQGRVQHPRRETLRLLADAMRLTGARRAELELAVDGASAGNALRDVYSAELAPPPTPLRPLTGRRPELQALTGLLSTEHERLLTIVGLPGVGKSRLAQEAALLLHARDRIPVLWVAMDGGDDPSAGVTRSPQSAMVSWVRALVSHGGNHDELTSVIRDKATLLVLDGLEASPTVGPALLNLLHSCERLKVLITAREPHQTPGGRLFPLAPLPVPGLSHASAPLPGDSLVADRPAVELMLSYVSHMRPDLLPTDSVTTTVAHVCDALDGVPQALEAAASWLLLYSPEQLLEIARTTPLALIDGATPDPRSGSELGRLLAAAVTGLRPQPAALLSAMASLADRADAASHARADLSSGFWTVQSAADLLGISPAEAARDVHVLLLRGLIRQPPAARADLGRPARFMVLNLVRRLLHSEPAPETTAHTPVLAGA